MKQRGELLDWATLPDRRKDPIMADLVDVGLTFARVFGRNCALDYFQSTMVEPGVYQRVLLGTYRQARPRSEPDDLAFAG